MKEKKFFLLLNLYIDGEISPSDAGELEQEIMRDPRHRRVYDDYCRIHRATKLVYDRFRQAAKTQSPETVRLFQPAAEGLSHAATESRGVQSRRSLRISLFAAGAAAACAFGFFITHYNLGSSPVAKADSSADSSDTAVVAEETDSPASYAAPFAAEVRADPYLPQTPSTRTNPFAMVSLSSDPAVTESLETTEERPAEISNQFTGANIPFSAIEGDESEAWMKPTKHDSSDRVFRSPSAGPQVEIEPVGYLIHR